MDMPGDDLERMRAYIEGKNYAALNDLLEPYRGQRASTALRRLPYLFGGVEILDEAQELGGESEAIDYLRQLYQELDGRDTAALCGLTWAWSIKSTIILAWFFAVTRRARDDRYCPAGGMTP